MKKHSNRKRINVLAIFTALFGIILITVGISFAAYVNRSFVKGVSSTPKQGFNLSSDYFSAVSSNLDSTLYPDKKILLAEKDEDDTSDYVFTFSINNSADGTIGTKNMKYYLYISDLPQNATVKFNNNDITSEVTSLSSGEKKYDGYEAPLMNAFSRVKHTYTVSIPKDKLGSAANILVKAVPDAEYDTSGYILAGKLQPSIIGTVAAFSHNDKILENGNVKDYAAFNYQVSVSNISEDKLMKIEWNSSNIEIDPLFLQSLGKVVANTGSLTLTMNATNSNYVIQFYRIPGGSISGWDDLGLKFTSADE